MQIDWAHFTPWTALAGGALIGVAAVCLYALQARIFGISGILGGLVGAGGSGDRAWRVAVVLGLLAAPLVAGALGLAAHLPAARMVTGWPTLVVAGLLVGWGTRHAGGCTSGHGVCGLSRRSPRSLLATGVFMATGVATVFVVRHGFGS